MPPSSLVRIVLLYAGAHVAAARILPRPSIRGPAAGSPRAALRLIAGATTIAASTFAVTEQRSVAIENSQPVAEKIGAAVSSK